MTQTLSEFSPVTLPDGRKTLSLSDKQYKEVLAILYEIYAQTRCCSVILIDASGMLVAQKNSKEGKISDQELTLLSALAAGNIATTSEMARLIGEQQGFKVLFYQGDLNSLYMTTITVDYSMVVVFPKSTTFGMVKLTLQKLSEDLKTILSRNDSKENYDLAKEELQKSMKSAEFESELVERLDSIMKFRVT
jgi:hypothetical protein